MFFKKWTLLSFRDATSNAGFNPGDDILDQQSSMIMKTSVAAFNQQRSVVAKLSRGASINYVVRILFKNSFTWGLEFAEALEWLKAHLL